MNHRLYRLHLLTSGLRLFGDAIETVALPWSLLKGTGSLVSIGSYALFTHLPWIFLPPLLGKSLDRTPKKVRLAFLALLLQSLLAVIVVPFSSNLWAFYIIVSGISALDILHRYYGFSLIAAMTLEESELQGLNATLSLVGNVVSLVAFPVAGALAYRFGVKAMLLDALLLAVGAAPLVPYLGVEISSVTAKEERAASPAQTFTRRFILGVLASLLLFNFALGSFRIFVFARLKEFATAEFLYGIMESLTALGSLIGVGFIAYLAHGRGVGAAKPLLLGMLLQSVALLLAGFPPIYPLISAVFIVGFGGELLNVSADSLFQKYLPLEGLGTARGLFDALATLVIPLSQLAFAWMIERSWEIQILVVLAFSMAVAAFLPLREILWEAKA
ncbi:MFS transporter [Thermococcus sp. Bubb.Bath]|uniref:MFS transporter n=1 Tax=Thermococcus sp. Bubb.Bath TaxID=1638242 RepID=UPI00143C43B4|nr:MFS transporter [Thermococcus sp. Bubb.Bath]NJF25017.1 MFS transporter [Thermococcus sp. Bubb.Bath]